MMLHQHHHDVKSAVVRSYTSTNKVLHQHQTVLHPAGYISLSKINLFFFLHLLGRRGEFFDENEAARRGFGNQLVPNSNAPLVSACVLPASERLKEKTDTLVSAS
jgi:hypothetical protein